MNSSEIEDKVITVLAAKLGIEKSKITRDKDFVQDLGADSLDVVEICIALEDTFCIEIPDGDAQKIKSVDNTISYVLAQLNAN